MKNQHSRNRCTHPRHRRRTTARRRLAVEDRSPALAPADPDRLAEVAAEWLRACMVEGVETAPALRVDARLDTRNKPAELEICDWAPPVLCVARRLLTARTEDRARYLAAEARRLAATQSATTAGSTVGTPSADPAEHWENDYTADGETVSRPCTCSIGRHHEVDGSTYDLGEGGDEDD